MMSKNIHEKLNEILSYLLNIDVFSKFGISHVAKYWKMGTDFFMMFDRFYENIKDLNIDDYLYIIHDISNLTTQGKNTTFQLFLNDKNVTPIIKKTKSASNGAMHQYIRSFVAFGIGIIEDKFDNYKQLLNEVARIKLVHNAKFLLESNNRIFLIKKIIVDALFSNVPDMRNIAYSILFECMLSYNYDLNNIDDQNRIFSWKKVIGHLNKKTIKYCDLLRDFSLIKKDIYNQGTIATYITIVKTINDNYKSFEDFINDIYNLFLENINDDINQTKYDDLINVQVFELNIKSQINSERSKFKNNIFNSRKNLNLIENKSDLYSDIIDINDNFDDLLVKFNEGEAAHIFDVFQIKDILLSSLYNNDISSVLKYISNPNNGLIMRHDYHKSFDRGQWTFDSNGNMIIPYENINYLFNILGLKRIKIRKEILNDEMKEFLIKR